MDNLSQIYQNSPFLEPRRPQRAVFAGALGGVVFSIFLRDFWVLGSLMFALILDLLLVLPYGLRLSAAQTMNLFLSADLRKGRLLKRSLITIAIAALFLSLSFHDLSQARSDLRSLQLFLYFFCVMLCWLQLQLSFATYYAKIFYRGNQISQMDDEEQGPQELIFPGDNEPVFTDFLYVANAVALTFAMSDVNIESSRMRKIVMIQALSSFMFYTLILSVVANLMVNS
ncbi:DUF1345 domain-containing protein [Synechococcus lacustris]|uniref:DUF1345 domain-containing protein n=1 Tax=Synechococcus lacustris TaxID=2116544 RepID=UPI0020CDA60E|nr:DUF1345 domain-containing protein [Synechococcus lacustris]MCP9921817.1 DUF1345 domain-containing protein [Synechococcus lacustris Cruz CV12-2]